MAQEGCSRVVQRRGVRSRTLDLFPLCEPASKCSPIAWPAAKDATRTSVAQAHRPMRHEILKEVMASFAPIPLTAYQRDIWTASAQLPELPRFNVGASVRLLGDVDLAVLRESCLRTVARNDAFALRFGEHDGAPYQWSQPETPEIDILDFSHANDPRADCLAWMERATRRPFDLAGGRLYDIALLRESATVAYL